MSAALAIEQLGTGEPVVLLHGWGLNLAVWRDIATSLAKKHRVVAIDLPGHGRSPWRAESGSFEAQMRAICASLPPGRLALVGWSLGGLFAMALAAQLLERVRRLVLVSTAPRFVAAPDWPHGLSVDVIRKFALQLATNYRGTVNDFLELQTRGSTHSAAVLSQLRHALRDRGDAAPEALGTGLEILERSDFRAILPAIKVPTLLIGGQYDRIVSQQAMAAFVPLLPQARARTITRAGHAPFLSHSAMFLREASEFLDDHD
jgi:pimeloyl-[acyl-carrier protein] methyl ester esterase